MIFVARKLDEGEEEENRHVVENPERDVVGGVWCVQVGRVTSVTASVELLPVLIGL